MNGGNSTIRDYTATDNPMRGVVVAFGAEVAAVLAVAVLVTILVVIL